MTLSRFISCGLSLECRQSQSCNLSAGIDIDCCSPSRQVDQDPAMTSNTVQFRCQCSTVICMRFSQPCRDIAFLTKVFILEEAVTESNVVERQAQSSGTKVKRTCSFVGTAVTPWESNHDQVSPFPGLCAFAGTLHHTLQWPYSGSITRVAGTLRTSALSSLFAPSPTPFARTSSSCSLDSCFELAMPRLPRPSTTELGVPDPVRKSSGPDAAEAEGPTQVSLRYMYLLNRSNA